MRRILSFVFQLILNTPFYPHWLEFRNTSIADKKAISYLKKTVLEIGSGIRAKESMICAQKDVTAYIAFDYPSWENQFETGRCQDKIMGKSFEIFTGRKPIKPDIYGDGNMLPFKTSSFDSVCFFETLEHI